MLNSCTGQRTGSDNPASWNEVKIQKWFFDKQWLQEWNVLPDSSINRKAFAMQYFRHPQRWDSAFSFLKNTGLDELQPGEYELDGTDLFVKVDEYATKDEINTKYEAHKKYADIQYLVRGAEKIGVASLDRATMLIPYDDTKDIGFYTISRNRYYTASPDNFFIFLPRDVHRPCVKISNVSFVKKIVIKVRVD